VISRVNPVRVRLDGLQHQSLLVVGEAVPAPKEGDEKPFTEVSGERSSWATVEISAELLASARRRASAVTKAPRPPD